MKKFDAIIAAYERGRESLDRVNLKLASHIQQLDNVIADKNKSIMELQDCVVRLNQVVSKQ